MKKILFFFALFISALNTNAQRNVILIIADDLSPDYFGFYEDHVDTIDAPNIRSLLSKGIRFTNAMSNPVCSATRSGILTGRYSFRTGVGGIVGGTGGSNQLDTAEITIPRLLKIYNSTIGTADIGKWHLHQPMPVSHLLYPNVLGYDHFEGPFIGQLPSYTNWTKYTNGVASTVTNYATSENVNNAVAWIKTQNTKPVFLWLAFNAPHEPLHLPPAGLYSNAALTGTQQNINANPKEYFKADLEALDHEIGRLFDSLTVMNRMDSTDFIFIGDNGNTPRTAQIADASRAKGTIYQYGVHVPFIISGPSVINPNRASDALINTADIFATVIELFGDTTWQSQIPLNKPVDSKSALPIIKNQATQIRPWAFTENFKLTPDSADGKTMRNMDYKLLNFDYGHQEFFNLSLDSLETNDLLTGILSAVDLFNYNYLCNEMTNLISAGTFCNSSVGINNMENINQTNSIYPNPFSSYIHLQSKSENENFKLTDCLGQIIYSGNKIESQDFSYLSNGIYFLQITSNKNKITSTEKIIKE